MTPPGWSHAGKVTPEMFRFSCLRLTRTLNPRVQLIPRERAKARRREAGVTPGAYPGSVRVAVRDDRTDSWADIELGTGEIADVIRLLEAAGAEAQAALDRLANRTAERS